LVDLAKVKDSYVAMKYSVITSWGRIFLKDSLLPVLFVTVVRFQHRQ